MSDPLVLVGSHNGRLGNQLIKAAHLLAFSCETGIPVVRLLERSYVAAFGCDDVATWPPKARTSGSQSDRRVERLARWLDVVRGQPWLLETVGLRATELLATGHGLAWMETPKCGDSAHPVVNLVDPAFVQMASEGSLVLYGYYFRVPVEVFTRHAGRVRAHFAFPERTREAARRRLKHARQRGRNVVSVHVRLGDFRTSTSHRSFFFTPDQYAHALRSWLDAEGRDDVTFILCSDERLSTAAFDRRGLRVELTRGDLLEDLCLLSLSDLIVGAPSSFSAWAAFHGERPLALLHRKGRQVEIAAEDMVVDPHDFHARVAEGRPLTSAFGAVRPASRVRRAVSSPLAESL